MPFHRTQLVVCKDNPGAGRSVILSDLGRCRVDDSANFAYGVGREATHFDVLSDQLLGGRSVNAVNLVVGDEAFQPLDLRPELTQDGTRFLRYFPEVGREAAQRRGNGWKEFCRSHMATPPHRPGLSSFRPLLGWTPRPRAAELRTKSSRLHETSVTPNVGDGSRLARRLSHRN